MTDEPKPTVSPTTMIVAYALIIGCTLVAPVTKGMIYPNLLILYFAAMVFVERKAAVPQGKWLKVLRPVAGMSALLFLVRTYLALTPAG